MAFPGPKVHRPSRRKLGRGQYPNTFQVPVTVTSTGTTNARLTFGSPVVVSGPIPLTVATVTRVSQTVVSPTIVDQVMSGNVSTHAYTLPANSAGVRSTQGAGNAAAAGTFS
jgi:hypothetical protein